MKNVLNLFKDRKKILQALHLITGISLIFIEIMIVRSYLNEHLHLRGNKQKYVDVVFRESHLILSTCIMENNWNFATI